MSIDKEALKLVRRVTKISFDQSHQKINEFAKKFVTTKDSLASYNTAFEEINQIRASSLLLETETWEYIIHNIKHKDKKDYREKEVIELYDLIIETFHLSPFAIFDTYVQKDDEVTFAEKIGIESTLCFSSLLYAYHFFKKLEREYFYRLTLKSLNLEIEKMKVFGQESELASIIKAAKKDKIETYEIFE